MERERPPDAATVYIVDDEPSVRDALRLLFHSVGLATAGFAGADEFLGHRLAEGPGCLVTDLRMPGLSGIELIEALRARGCMLPAVVVSGHGDVRLAVRALKCGATDFLEKPFHDQDLLDIVNGALQACRHDNCACTFAGGIPQSLERLTAREREVLRLVVAGLPNKLIGRQLGVSTRTVESHRASLMRKLQADSVAGLVALALRGGLLGDGEDRSQ
ncbi:MAG: response regulator transcription factor [Rhodocyclales bacterium]|nr:response regulator transcription factor [Rhodocyclales bacterium]